MANANTPTEELNALLLHLEGAYAPNTLRAYRADMLEFIQYCEGAQESALPADPGTVARFLMQTLGHGHKSATIRRKVSSISAIHRLSELMDPTKHPEVKITLRKIARQLGTRYEQAYPVTRALLDVLLSVCSQDLRGLRDKALLLLAYDSMRRRSELVSLRVEDMHWPSALTARVSAQVQVSARLGQIQDGGASILLRKSKTDQMGTGQWIHLSHETTQVVLDWLEAARIEDGFVLRGIDPAGHVTASLCESRVARIFKSLARRAKLSEHVVQGISGHSMRVGGAQDLMTQGASLPQIMVKGGWAKTDTVMRYVQRVRPANACF